MDYELLQLKTIHEVRALTTQKGLRWVKTDRKIKLIKNLMEIPEPIKPDENIPKPVIVTHTATHDEILEVTEEHRKRGLLIRFDEDGWHMRNPSTGREDSGHLTVALHVVRRIANTIAPEA